MNFIKQRRYELGLSQRDLAKKLSTNGSTVYLWEQGRTPSAKAFPKLAQALGVSVAELMKELGVE